MEIRSKSLQPGQYYLSVRRLPIYLHHFVVANPTNQDRPAMPRLAPRRWGISIYMGISKKFQNNWLW